MEPRISLVTLGVADVERSAEFYRDLGLLMMDRESDDVAFFTLDGTWLAIYRRDLLEGEVHAGPGDGESARGDFGGFTLAHNVESKEAVDSVIEEAARAGADVVQAGIERDWGGYSGYFADPDGHRWEVAWNPHFEIE